VYQWRTPLAGTRGGRALPGVRADATKQQGATLVGWHREHPRKATATPTAERLLQAFVPITLTQVQLPEQVVRHVTPLTPLQQQILALLGFPADLYASLVRDIPQTAFPLRE